MYNTTINPLNIVYRKPPKYQGAENPNTQNKEEQEKSAIESRRRESAYSEINSQTYNGNINFKNINNTVNIAQIIKDFKNTNAAINAPKEVQDEVNLYLSLVEKESLKDDPQRNIILSNLKNASRVSDKYIADTLKKPSNVVEGWIDALFAQNVVLKSDPNQINEVFQLKFQEQKTAQSTEIKETDSEEKKKSPFKNSSEYYADATTELKKSFSLAKKITEESPVDALKQYDEALKIAANDKNTAFEGAIHFEKGKIFDQFDYIPNALDEYQKATLSPDENLKSNAHLKMARIYDDYAKFEPALDNYHQAIAYFGEANNPKGQTIAVKGLSGIFAQKYDKENTKIFNKLTIESAKECHDNITLGDALNKVAKNYEYIGESKEALNCYRQSAKTYSADEKSTYEVGQNYLEASKLMRKLGNGAKADSLLAKAHQYFELSGQTQSHQV